MSRSGRPTINDIAREAGASPATVSRVMSNSRYPVRDEVRQRILQAARKLDYSPNLLGRMLRSNDSRVIGIVVPTIANPFYSQVVIGMETEARRRGYGTLLCNTFRDAAEEEKCLRWLFDRQVLGVALSSVAESHGALRELARKGLRAVFIDQAAGDMDCARIGFNYIRGGVIAAEHLIARGHSRMAFLTSPLVRRSRLEQFEGFKMGHSMHALDFNPAWLLEDEAEAESPDGAYEFECGKRLAVRLLMMKERPTAVFAANDMIAAGALQHLSVSGVSVPGDISVVGFDNILLSQVVHPPLTTIEQPSAEIGRLACRMIVEMLEGGSGAPAISLEPTLIERDSVKTLP
jgi:LacI family transcriptional regulator